MSVRKQQKTQKAGVRKLLEDTGQAYTMMCESHTNADYADFASSQALESFKQALDNPELTYDDLCKILRKASTRASSRQCKTPWSMFMANYIAKHSNANQSGHFMSISAANNGGKLH